MFSIKSSEPIISAKSLYSDVIVSKGINTAIRFVFPVPLGKIKVLRNC